MTFSRAIKFGNSRIEFVRFPYRANDQIVVRWLTPPGIQSRDQRNVHSPLRQRMDSDHRAATIARRQLSTKNNGMGLGR